MAEVGDPLVSARVQREEISSADLDQAVWDAVASNPSGQIHKDWPWMERTRARHLEQMIEERLLGQHLRRLGVEVSSEEVEAALQKRGGSRGTPNTKISDEREISARLREQLAVEKVLEQLGRSEPTEEELMRMYQQYKERFRAPSRSRVDMYLIALGARSEETDSTQQESLRVREILEGNEALQDLSEEGGSVLTHNNRWVTHAQLPALLRRSISSAPAGSILGPLRSAQGLHMVRVQEQRAAGYLDPSEPEVRQTLGSLARRNLLKQHRKQLLKGLNERAEVLRFDHNWHRVLQRNIRHRREAQGQP